MVAVVSVSSLAEGILSHMRTKVSREDATHLEMSV